VAKQNKKNNQAGILRIIAGKWRGRKIHFPDVESLRPTPDRIRETLFNWLQNKIGDSRCLDLFSGSGALGLEAASRGASHVDLIELDNQAVRQLQENCQQLSAEQCQVIQSTAQDFLTVNFQQYDIVFIDPPFQANLWTEIADLLVKNKILVDNALIYLECPKKQDLPELPLQWQLIKEKTAGDVRYCLFSNKLGDGE
jgi:16S rRNA (guanine966-N2)-methyltransferase